jgi:hypothetical protein
MSSYPTLFINRKQYRSWIIVAVYVDDCLLLSPCSETITTFEDEVSASFNIKRLGRDWVMVKRIFRYLKGTTSLRFGNNKTGQTGIASYADASYATEESRNSRTGYVVQLGGSCIVWNSQRQRVVALSTLESEYIAAVSCFNQENS